MVAEIEHNVGWNAAALVYQKRIDPRLAVRPQPVDYGVCANPTVTVVRLEHGWLLPDKDAVQLTLDKTGLCASTIKLSAGGLGQRERLEQYDGVCRELMSFRHIAANCRDHRLSIQVLQSRAPYFGGDDQAFLSLLHDSER